MNLSLNCKAWHAMTATARLSDVHMYDLENLDRSFSRCFAHIEASHTQSSSSSRMFCLVTRSTSHLSIDKTDFESECESDSYALNDFSNSHLLCRSHWVRLNATEDLSALLITVSNDSKFIVSRTYIWISLLIFI